VLADEPTGNLDSESSAEVMTLLREIHAEGRTVVLVTHALDVAQAASRLIHVRDGQVVVEASESARSSSEHGQADSALARDVS
jgi:ABC-type lipoprotein export system ATPase subunit